MFPRAKNQNQFLVPPWYGAHKINCGSLSDTHSPRHCDTLEVERRVPRK